MKIYLADKFEHKMKMRYVRDVLQADGHEVTSQWIDVEHEEDESQVITDEDREGFACMDYNDVLRSDVLVAFSYPRSLPSKGGGRHVEFGFAISEGLDVVVVGPKGEHIFHYFLESRMFVDDVEGLIPLLAILQAEHDFINGKETVQ